MPCSPSVLQQYGNILTVASISVAPTGSDRYPGRRIFTADTFREYLWDGTGWIVMAEPDQVTTPTISNWAHGTGGSASKTMTSHRQDGWCDFTAVSTLGTSGASVTGTPSLTLPYAAADKGIFVGGYDDVGSSFYPMSCQLTSSTALALYVGNSASTYLAAAAVSATLPATWIAGDNLFVAGRYRMATRYL